MNTENLDEGWVVVQGAADGFAQDITAGAHHLLSDEPTSAGGTATGPNPYDLLLAALGACTSMTLAMYARRQRWPLEHVTVRLRRSRAHAKDCADCENPGSWLSFIEREIELRGSLDEPQRARLLEIASRCPIHRSLTSPIEIRTELK